MAKIKPGDSAPDFTLPWTGEGEFTLSDHRGEWVVLAFYPGDFTSVCTKQFCNYRDGAETIDGLDATIVGISPQGVESHEKFIDEYSLNVPLVADEEMEAAAAYGVGKEGGKFLRRAIFVIDPEGVVRHANVKLLGATFDDANALASALDEARSATAAA